MTKVTLFAAHKAEMSGKVAQKAELLKHARNTLEEAQNLYSLGNDKAKNATELAEVGALDLFKAECEGLTSRDETTGVLGDVFGYKQKKDGSLSKTPEGQGEVIRKRVVRAIQVNDYVNKGGDCPAFLEGCDKEEAGQILLQMSEGNGLSIYSAYDKWGKMKERTTIDPAFDAVRIAKIVASLRSEGAQSKIEASPALIAAYAELLETLDNMTQDVSSKEAAKIKQAA